MPIQEAYYIYKINKGIRTTIRTPVGETEPVELQKDVRQGTVGGETLCGVSTDRINTLGTYEEMNDGIKYPVFVDDMIGMGVRDKIEEMIKKMNTLVTKK